VVLILGSIIMLMASRTIMESFKANFTELSTIRTNWTEQYANELSAKTDDAIENQLGIDSKRELRNASTNLNVVIGPARRDLSSFKTQVDDDFKNDTRKLKEILKNLGITKNLRSVQKGDQEGLIELLYTFKKNMTDKLKQEITGKGMNPVLIDNINGYANTVKSANVSQETLKETTKEISSEVASVFNAIYDEIIGICKIASNFYQYEHLKKEQFTYSKVISNMNAAKKISEEPQE